MRTRLLAQVMKYMVQQGFNASKGQYLRQLKKWNLSKNLSAKDWKCISRRIEARSRLGKTSQVTIGGRIIPQEKVRKETNRHNLPSFLPQSPSPDLTEGILVYTPRDISATLEKAPTPVQLPQASADTDFANHGIFMPKHLPYFEFLRLLEARGEHGCVLLFKDTNV